MRKIKSKAKEDVNNNDHSIYPSYNPYVISYFRDPTYGGSNF